MGSESSQMKPHGKRVVVQLTFVTALIRTATRLEVGNEQLLHIACNTSFRVHISSACHFHPLPRLFFSHLPSRQQQKIRLIRASVWCVMHGRVCVCGVVCVIVCVFLLYGGCQCSLQLFPCLAELFRIFPDLVCFSFQLGDVSGVCVCVSILSSVPTALPVHQFLPSPPLRVYFGCVWLLLLPAAIEFRMVCFQSFFEVPNCNPEAFFTMLHWLNHSSRMICSALLKFQIHELK